MLAGIAGVGFLLVALAVVIGIDQTFGVYWSNGSSVVNVRSTITGDTEVGTVFTIAASGADQEQQLGFDVANMKGLLITVTGNTGGTVVLETNSTSSPGTTLTFPAGGGELVWSNRSPLTNPFGSTDVTTTFWSNNGTGTATVTFRALLNS